MWRILQTILITISLGVCLLPPASQAQEPSASAPFLVFANFEAEFASSLSGTVEEVPFEAGDRFVEGDTLVRLNCAVQRAQVEAAAAEQEAAEAEFAARKSLQARGGLGRLQVQVAKAQASAAGARLRLAEAVVDGCEIKAPFDGRVVETTIKPFEYVQPARPLLSVVSTGPLKLTINAPSEWLRRIEVGMRGRAQFSETGERFAIEITGIGAAVDPVSATIDLSATFVDRPADVLPGMSGLASFQ